MFRKILVALDYSLDYSEITRPILDEAISLAKVMEAKLMLLHVLSPDDSAGRDLAIYPGAYYLTPTEEWLETYRQEWEQFKDRNLQQLENDTESAKAAGISAECCQIFGNPGRSICEFAKNWETELILMGRRGRKGLSELFLGSVSNYVLHHAHCAVLTLNPGFKPKAKLP
jgi:nucleotide-binding universal stress UspA family protein